MQDEIIKLAEQWIGYKTWLIEAVGISNDAMHVHGSLLILCISAILLRRRPDSILCWFIVLVAELFNEYADLRGLAPGEATLDASLHDLYNTMLWPTVILLMGRLLFPRRWPKKLPVTEGLSDQPQQSLEQSAAV